MKSSPYAVDRDRRLMKRAAAVVLRELACHFGVTITRGCQIVGSLTPPGRRKNRLPVTYLSLHHRLSSRDPALGLMEKEERKSVLHMGRQC